VTEDHDPASVDKRPDDHALGPAEGGGHVTHAIVDPRTSMKLNA
jgi:hypothetical protein